MSYTALLEHTNDLAGTLPGNGGGSGGAQQHVQMFASGVEAHYTLAADPNFKEAKYGNAGINFDKLADGKPQSIARKFGWAILAWQGLSLLGSKLGGRGGGNLAMAYGQGGGWIGRAIATLIAVVFLTDLSVIPPVVDFLQESAVDVWNYLFNDVVGGDGGTTTTGNWG